MILILQHQTILARHDDGQTVTFQMYPSATAMKRIPDGTVILNDIDPTIADPSLILDEDYQCVEDWPIQSLRTQRLTALRQDADRYLNRYDLGAKLAYLGEFCLLLQKKIDGTLTDDDASKMNELTHVMLWTRSVLMYYTSLVRQLVIATDNSTLMGVTWNFDAFDDSDPNIQIVGFYG